MPFFGHPASTKIIAVRATSIKTSLNFFIDQSSEDIGGVVDGSRRKLLARNADGPLTEHIAGPHGAQSQQRGFYKEIARLSPVKYYEV